MMPGPVLLLGSGETVLSGQKAFDQFFRLLPEKPRVALLETPAGFELNSGQVIGRVADFLEQRLQNYSPRISVIPACKRGTEFSPDSEEIAAPLLQADLIFMGPGSPSYAIRQLRGSLAWQYLLARNFLGAGLAFASAGVVAVSRQAIPVYEIYKVGEDIHWIGGLDYFSAFGLNLVLIPHWNNQDGGEELDTSRCFIGRERFDPMADMLPPENTILGIDENTSLLLDFQVGQCQVIGQSSVTVIHAGQEKQFLSGGSFPIDELGAWDPPDPGRWLPSEIWDRAGAIQNQEPESLDLPDEVQELLDQREAARRARDWSRADTLRDQISEMGWQIEDTPEGARIIKK